MTGNLVTAGYGIATGNPSLVRPTVTAVAGPVVGEITWARLLRRPDAANGLLITELALFLLVLAAWLAAGPHPASISALALLALVSVALGGESIWALRIHQTTTYFIGMLTKTVNAAVSANADVGTSLRREALTETGLAERIEPPSLAHAAPGSGNRLVTTLAGGAALRSHRMPESASPRP